MSKICPESNTTVLYLDCLDCDSKSCRKVKSYKYAKVVIGIDQSYKNTGISISADGELKLVKSIFLESYKSNSEKRRVLSNNLDNALKSVVPKAKEVICIVERIRLRSQGFLNINYIKSIGALNSIIVDKCSEYNVPVYSVDTRCWKAQIVGTSKPSNNPKYAMEPEKYPTFAWLKKQNNGKFIKSVMIDMSNNRKSKNVFEKSGKRYKVNDDACDSAAISMFGFKGDKSKLQKEE